MRNKSLQIEQYTPTWETSFNALKKELSEALELFPVRIEHVGSTAIPGLCAKPILDIDIIIPENRHLPGISTALHALGYESRGDQGIADRYAFRPIANTRIHRIWPDQHLYVCLEHSLALKNHLRFRDALLQDPALRAAYAQLKQALLEETGITRKQYNARKTVFITGTLRQCGLTEEELAGILEANQ